MGVFYDATIYCGGTMKPEQYEIVIGNLEQIIQALGCVNRLYYYRYFGKEAETDEDLMRFYIKQGGAINYRRKKDARP